QPSLRESMHEAEALAPFQNLYGAQPPPAAGNALVVENGAHRTEAPLEVGKKGNCCALGSVKTNIGHCDSAAGIAGLIKTVLSLENRRLVPSLHCEKPNPQLDLEHSPFYVNTQTMPCPREHRFA